MHVLLKSGRKEARLCQSMLLKMTTLRYSLVVVTTVSGTTGKHPISQAGWGQS